jgi:hypothetical protein
MIMHGKFWNIYLKGEFLKKMVIKILKQNSIMIFFFGKIQLLHINWLQSKNDGKHGLNIKFSYVVIIYQVWNNDNTLNVTTLALGL